MIYTLTLSPSIDLYMHFSELRLGTLCRAEDEYSLVGGKGINVSFALKQLGLSTIPIAVIGGFTGSYVEEVLKKSFDPILISSHHQTRINPKLKEKETETELNAPTKIEPECLRLVKEQLDCLNKEDILIVSGNSSYEAYQFILKDIKARLVLDISGNLLKRLDTLKPWIVKPNEEELAQINPDEEKACLELLENASIVLYTKGKKGAEVRTKTQSYSVQGKKTISKSSVGCGDAFLAGFLAYYLKDRNLLKALEFANECGYYRAKNNDFLVKNSC